MFEEPPDLPVIDLQHERVKRIVFYAGLVVVAGLAVCGIISYQSHEREVQKQHVVISKIEWHEETRRHFKIVNAVDDSSTQDIVLPTGVPSTKTDISTKVTYDDGTSASVDASPTALQVMVNRDYSYRTSGKRFAVVFGKIKETNKPVEQKLVNTPFQVGDSVLVSKFRDLENEYDNVSSSGAFNPENREDVVEQIVNRGGNQ